MIYYANPTSPRAIEAMQTGRLGYIDTPLQGNRRPPGVSWCADNGCFSDKWDQEKWWTWLQGNAHDAPTCTFAVAPDVVGDAWRTGIRALPWIEPIKRLGYPVAWVAQDGQQNQPLPWLSIDALFIGGTTAWKVGPHARDLVAEAKRRGLWAHMGRVNSERRWRYAKAIGCDSVDGTYLTFGPDVNLSAVLAWGRNNDQGALFGGTP